jgi:hypothetical protein
MGLSVMATNRMLLVSLTYEGWYVDTYQLRSLLLLLLRPRPPCVTVTLLPPIVFRLPRLLVAQSP